MSQRLWAWFYTWLFLPVMYLLIKILAIRNQNLRETLEGHQGLWERIDQQFKKRDLKKPLIWFHVASAGEYLQAQPVIERCVRAGAEYALTFTSVNAYKWLSRTPFPEGQHPIIVDYLPYDSPYNVRRFLAIVQPSAIVYVKFDLWPNLLWEARQQRIPQYLISAAMAPQSPKVTSAWGHSFFRTLYPCLDGIFTVTEEDRERILTTNPDYPNIQVMGNTRYDSVIARRDQLPPPQLPSYVKSRFVFIAGSTWPPDEECIFPALIDALKQFPELLIAIVPHEPTPDHLHPTEKAFQEFPIIRWSKLNENSEEARVILVDTVGILSSLYYVGNLAYIGGAFTTGVHNTMEPCAFGVPVIFGPKYDNYPEARTMVQQQLATTVNSPEAFREILFQLLNDLARVEELGKQVQSMIESQCGAAEQCFQVLQTHIHEDSFSS